MSTTQPIAGAARQPAAMPAQDAPIGGLSIAMQVMALRSAGRQDRIEGMQSDVRTAQVNRQAEVEARLEAMRRAEEAQGDAGFWGKVADVLKVVALVATIVVGVAGAAFTAGASGLAAAGLFALLTATMTVAPYAAEAVASATNMTPEARLGLSVGVAALCIAGAILNPGAAATSTANIATASARMTSALAQTSVAVQRMAQCVELLARFTNGYSSVVGGLATMQAGEATADAQRHQAQSTAAGQRREEAMGRLEDVYRDALRATRQVMQTIEIEDQTSQAALRA